MEYFFFLLFLQSMFGVLGKESDVDAYLTIIGDILN